MEVTAAAATAAAQLMNITHSWHNGIGNGFYERN